MMWLWKNKTALFSACSFLLVIVFLWLDELLDLPSVLFRAPATPVNTAESIFETIVIVLLALLVLSTIYFLDKKVRFLKMEKAKILSIVSHDLKNTFTGLIGHTRLLNNPPDQLTPEDYRELSSVIYASSKRIITLMENLLHWSRLNSGIIPVHPSSFSLAEAVAANIILVQYQAQAKNISILHSIEPSLTVTADKNMIDSVLHNILHNAIKFSPDGGTISIQAINEKHSVQLMVTDNGVGLATDIPKQIGNLQPGNTHPGTHGEKGSGLGLYICREFMNLNHGGFSIENHPGQGATVMITLPKTAA